MARMTIFAITVNGRLSFALDGVPLSPIEQIARSLDLLDGVNQYAVSI